MKSVFRPMTGQNLDKIACGGNGASVWAGMMGHMIRLFLPCMQIVHLLAQSHLVGGEMSSCARVQIKEQAAALKR